MTHDPHERAEAPQSDTGAQAPQSDAAAQAPSADSASAPSHGAPAVGPQAHPGQAYSQHSQHSQPGQYGQPPSAQSPYDQTPHSRPPYGQPPYGQAPYGQAPYGQAPGPQRSPYHAVQPQAARKDRRGVGVPLFLAGVIVAGLLGGGVGAGAAGLLAGDEVEVGGSGVQINDPGSATAVTAAADKASPSVATLAVTAENAAGSGSGIILDNEGHILTNTHVVTLGGATAEAEISVRLHDGSVRTAEIVGTDPLSDLAVIQLEDASGVVPAELGSSSDLNVGDQAIAIGAPLGLDGTVTDGIISTLDRTISVASAAVEEDAPDVPEPEEGEPEEGDGFEFFFPDMEASPSQGSIHMNVIQTDAAINQGNSGGALVDSQGRVIGVNVAIASSGGGMSEAEGGSIGVGFSIPMDYAQRVAEDIISDGEVSHGLLGVTVNAAGMEDQPLAPGGGFATGAFVEEVAPDSPAAEAELQPGDVITEVDGRRIDDSLTLTAIVREYRGGDTVTVTYVRDGDEEQAEVTLGGL